MNAVMKFRVSRFGGGKCSE